MSKPSAPIAMTRYTRGMEWSDDGIVLSSRPHGETGLVASLLTRAHGRHAGFIHGGVSRKSRPIWQPGNVVEVAWRARLAEQLGNFTGEVREPHAARVLDDAVELAGLAAACAMADAALPEREPHPACSRASTPSSACSAIRAGRRSMSGWSSACCRSWASASTSRNAR